MARNSGSKSSLKSRLPICSESIIAMTIFHREFSHIKCPKTCKEIFIEVTIANRDIFSIKNHYASNAISYSIRIAILLSPLLNDSISLMLNSVTNCTGLVDETAPARIPASEKSLIVPFLIVMLVRPGSTMTPSTPRTSLISVKEFYPSDQGLH